MTGRRYTSPDSVDQTHELRRVPFLASLSPAQAELLSAELRRRRFPRNEVIFHRDDPGNCLFIVTSGSVKIVRRSEDGRELFLSLIREGEYFGELSLLDGQPRSADAITVEAVEVLVLSRESFLAAIERTPEVAIQMLGAMSRHYVRRLTDVVEDATFLDVSSRLARILLHLVDGEAEGSARIQLTQGELASMIGATRESVNKWIGFFERRGWLRRERGGIVILDAVALTEYSSPR